MTEEETTNKINTLEAKIAELEAKLTAIKGDDVAIRLLFSAVNKLRADMDVPKEPEIASERFSRSQGDGTIFMPDGNCVHTTASKTATLEWRKNSDAHDRELQLKNAHLITKETDGLAQYPSIAVDTNKNGALAWARIHSQAGDTPVVDSGSGNVGDGERLARWNHAHPLPTGLLPDGTNEGDMAYWNGSAWVILSRPAVGGTPAQAAVLAYSNSHSTGSKLYWCVIDTALKVVQRNYNGGKCEEVTGDWVKGHV
jgi:hypothetical protein